ncbi:MAG: hypothetical protein WCG42_08535 [Parachlamydiaceae bacterium]
MKKTLCTTALILSNLIYSQPFPSVQTTEEVQNELNFLTSTSDQVGFAYKGIAGSLNARLLPIELL